MVTWILKLSQAQINNAFSACSVLRADDHVTKRILFKEDFFKKIYSKQSARRKRETKQNVEFNIRKDVLYFVIDFYYGYCFILLFVYLTPPLT